MENTTKNQVICYGQIANGNQGGVINLYDLNTDRSLVNTNDVWNQAWFVTANEAEFLLRKTDTEE